MGKGKRLAVEFQLPEALIQHIQSFLNAKEAARTTLLSKSWHTAWLTRPNLNFDQKDFNSVRRFWRFVNKIVRRYVDSNLKVDSLKLWVYGSYDEENICRSLAKKLIVKAIAMGVTTIDFKVRGGNRKFSLPYKVFRSENLITLSVSGCKIRKGADGEVSCPRLKSLTLNSVYVESHIIWDIISSCPLIENLSVHKVAKFGKGDEGSVVNGFHNLKSLILYRIDVGTLFWHDFSSRFPCLKDLTLHGCSINREIQISGPSLEYISIIEPMGIDVKFDVPNIRKFTFSDTCIPSLSFTTTRSTWESHISIKRERCAPNAAWFLQLNKLLRGLSLSKVSLSLEIMSEKSLDCGEIFLGLPKPEVENLKISGPCSVCPDLFYSLVQCCRPMYINQSWFPRSIYIGKKIKEFRDFVYKRTMLQVSLNSCFAYQRMSGGCDLEEVSVEFYDEAVSAWCPRLLDTSASQGADEQKHRLHLRWGR